MLTPPVPQFSNEKLFIDKNKKRIRRRKVKMTEMILPVNETVTETKTMSENPFAGWNMPPQPEMCFKGRDFDCF